MAHEAEMNERRSKSGSPNVVQSLSGLTHDAIELAELQARLFKLDAQTAARDSGKSIAFLGLAGALLLASLPVLLLALAEVFVNEFGWPRVGSLGAAAGTGLALSVGVGLVSWRFVRSALSSLERSREELSHNLAWIKSHLKHNKS